MRNAATVWPSLLLGALLGTSAPTSAGDDRMGVPPTRAEPAPPVGVLEAARESLFGDVYVEPTHWRELPLSTFFTEGWDEPWASPVTGGGGAPRQGWINAAGGVELPTTQPEPFDYRILGGLMKVF